MWLRRSGAVRNANGQPVQAEPFNPNHRRYRTCCCHCKTFTLGFGVVEMFLICFCLVAIAPDFNSKICHFQSPPPSTEWPNGTPPSPPPPPPPPPQQALESTTATMSMPMTVAETAQPPDSIAPPLMMAQRRRRRRRQLEQPPNNNMPGVLAIMAQKMSASTAAPPAQAYSMGPWAADQQQGFNTANLLRQLTCSLTYLWISWALLQMLSIVLMCLGVKRQRWILLIPHIFLRICCALLIWLVIVALIGAFFQPPQQPPKRFSMTGAIIMCIFLFLIFLWICLLLKSEIRCCEFVKRSAETGFSVSITRPIGPPTVSQSDSARGGDHVRRIVQSGIRKMAAQPAAAGPSAKRYQTKQQQLEESQQENGQEMTMSTLATAGGGGGTRPSTAGSLQQQGQQQQRLGSATAAEDVLSRASRRLSGRPPSNGAEFERLEPREGGLDETHFGEAGGGGRPGGSGGGLPPLRHTYRLGG